MKRAVLSEAIVETRLADGIAPDGKAARVREMFARIVPRYDLVNSLMTLGLDRRWRRATINIVKPANALALDIATGTGELAFELVRQGARGVIGLDFCHPMVMAARAKANAAGGAVRPSFGVGDALRLPFKDATFDCVVNGFMLRNVADLSTTFAELFRVLTPGGRLACLDLTPPRGPLGRFFDFYIASFVPILGVMVGRDYRAYRYLSQSLSMHPDAEQIAAMMRAAGFVASYQLTGFGTVAIHLGRKP